MHKAPKLATKLFHWASGQAQNEDLLGDLQELYEDKLESKGEFRARLFYWLEVIKLSFSYALRKRKKDRSLSNYYSGQKLNTMILNYIKISIRNIKKQKLFTGLNVFGLALGMSVALLCLAMVSDLKQFDRFHQDSEDIYRITTKLTTSGDRNHFASSPPALAELLRNSSQQITNSAVINDHFFPTIKSLGEPIEMHGYYTEPSFLELFDFKLQRGNANVIDNPRSVIITHELAEKLFNSTDVIGKTIETERDGIFEIGGVLAPFPQRTHFKFDLLANISGTNRGNNIGAAGWTDFSGNYFYFKSEASKGDLETMVGNLGQSGQAFFDLESSQASYHVQAITEINPGPNYSDRIGVIFGYDGLLYFIGVSLMVLIPACFNYINMAIANTLNRTKEIGIRKIIGSPNKFIIRQFLVETIIVCIISLLLSTVLFNLIKGEFTSMLVGAEALTFEMTPLVIIMFLGFAILTGLVTGVLPALYLARIAPISAINNRTSNKKVSISGFRKGLLVFQFILSLSFMIGIGVVLRQYSHTITYDPGFAKENRIILPLESNNVAVLQNELQAINGVEDISFSSNIPGLPLNKTNYFYSDDFTDSILVREIYISEEFVDKMNLKMVWGESQLSDVQFEQVLVNEKLLSLLNNIENNPQDSLIRQLASKQVQIVGIVADYNHEPLNERIEPMVMRLNESAYNYAIIELNGVNGDATLANIEAAWNKLQPESQFQPRYLESIVAQSYDFMFTAMKIFGFLALISITISSLGLLGMVVYSTENRRKEVAIRKILGANAMTLFGNLSGMFLKLWLIALLIAIPGAYFFYDNLFVNIYNKFSGGVHFAEVFVSSLLTIIIGLSAIFWQSRRIIRINPAENLRND
ncbi:MAG: ABC transporter permease [Roseivirga sp.]|jgi:ABC-type antimicrobial peptide transport system permease subunit|uniref:FtsX-like permease family protein n=1 Tax=Roseivirga sp. TaxID=1964215 RepID=UPI001B038E73|nr:FtsX-like permease family protein [Roseivirga sp.]MBO6495653.1 ABC transporter permease [Roseivirga sp.]